MISVFSKITELQESNIPFALCIIVSTKGSTPRKAGSKMLVMKDGSIFGTIGGGSIELAVIHDALDVIRSGEAMHKQYQLEEDLSMHCGGTVEVYFDPVLVMPRLFIFGAGHVGRAVAKYASTLGFRIVFFDERPDIYKEFDVTGFECTTGNYLEAIEKAVFDEDTYIVITTPKHEFDEKILAAVGRKPHAYLGMIGSKRKVAEARKRFIAENILTDKELDAVDMPIGIPMAAETPEEIAISIIAKLIDVRNTIKKS
jgi:xanthine dehydrogenase accessory factor